MSAPAAAFIPCSGPRALPGHMLMEGARVAWEHNPANYPMAGHIALVAPGVDMPQAIALLTTKFWGARPRKIGVSFMEQTSRSLAKKILANMNAWTKTGGITFAGTNGTGDVRISREADGYWSYLGTDVTLVPPGEPTMSLQAFSLDTPESEYLRVVRHETGHTLGFPHEHMRADIVSRLDPEKTVAYFLRTYGWPRPMTVEQVLTPLDERSLMGTPADVDSIMTYQLPGEITGDGVPIPGGADIDKSDYAFCGKVYPRAKGAPAS